MSPYELQMYINDTWGHTSKQALYFHNLREELERLKKLETADFNKEIKTDLIQSHNHKIDWKDAAASTFAYFGARAIFIIGAWLAFILAWVLIIGIIFLLWQIRN